MTDGRTDRQTDGGDCNIPDGFFKKKRGDKKGKYIKVRTYNGLENITD